jgi:hypothetical protein
MTTPIETVKLEDLESVEELSTRLVSATAAGAQTIMLLHDSRVVGTVVPPNVARDMFARMVAEHWAEHPDAIFDLETRLRTETPEDWTD